MLKRHALTKLYIHTVNIEDCLRSISAAKFRQMGGAERYNAGPSTAPDLALNSHPSFRQWPVPTP